MKYYLQALFWSLPIWVLLIVENYFIPAGNIDQILSWINIPGVFLVILLNPSWSGLHNTETYVLLAVNCLIYYSLIYLFLYIKSRLRVKKGKVIQ